MNIFDIYSEKIKTLVKNLSKQNLKIDKSQAIASIGQIELMNLFNKIFSLKKN